MPEALNSPMSFEMDHAGFVRLSWTHGTTVTGELAREAVTRLADFCDGQHLPMLVDMTSTKAITRPARVIFTEDTSATRISLLGKSSVDRVIANFTLGVTGVPVPTRFFTDEALAIAWLINSGGDREF
ncbi:MAG: STAS/SEC14 domain-containing protein [Ornithinimicrobium sp.]